jgi:ATP-dependent helicase HepA
MALPSFVPGQRWISNTEVDLGLGMVVEMENRRVTLAFPAVGERRTYAVDNAPISRIEYNVGEKITNLDGESLTITSVNDHNGCLFYAGEGEEGEELQWPELELDCFVQFSSPKDRLFSGQVDKLSRYQLRRDTLDQFRRLQESSVSGLLGPRVQLLPHQLYIAHEAGSRHAPRVLLADEVGLGKTIEAGLILHQQLHTARSQRALIVVPDSLVHQWLVEMLRRFNLHFTILDSERCLELDDNPFESAQLILCSLSFLSENPDRMTQAVSADWDLLLVDEAHHLRWHQDDSGVINASVEYQCIEALAEVARGLLLLTATPEQLGIESHFARLRLLDPDRYYDLNRFLEEEAGYEPVNALVQKLLALLESESDDALVEQTFSRLGEYLSEESAASLKALYLSGEPNEAVEQATHALLDRHGTGRVLFRNTRQNIEGFPERKLHAHALAPEDVPSIDLTTDPKVLWLLEWLKDHRDKKVLLICAEAETAIALDEHLRFRKGVASSAFHEGLSLLARDRAAAYFADEEEHAQILVCSEIGSEGRNFQFSHHLVLFDLPKNPDLLEQRIGRLDRIGQRHTVNIHVPYTQDSEGEVLLRWYNEGLNSFEQSCAAGQNVFEMYETELLQCMQTPDQHDALESLLQKAAASTSELMAKLHEGRDRLLELNSCNKQGAEKVVDGIIEGEQRAELMSYMEGVFDQFGVDQERHSASSIVLHPSEHMQVSHFPGLPEGGMTATFHRETALSRDDIHFLTWEHPMVTGVLEMILGGDFGNTSVCTIKLPPLKPGTLLLEATMLIQSSAPRSLQLSRYLPLTSVRIVIDNKGTDLGHILSIDKLDQLVQKIPRNTAQDLVRHTRAELNEMVARAEDMAANQQREVVAAAIEKMKHEQHLALERLQALLEVNPNIRSSEIDALKEDTQLLNDYLQNTRLRLDSLRVIVAV